jgi:hypothetical protein
MRKLEHRHAGEERFNVKVRINSKVKDNGQECPFHTRPELDQQAAGSWPR